MTMPSHRVAPQCHGGQVTFEPQDRPAGLGFSADPERSATLPGHYYHDPDIYRREKEAIWFRTWQLAGYLHDLQEPGDYLTADLLDQKILVCRDRAGGLRAYHNVCMHRGHIIAEGKGNRSIFTCPFHAWSYDLEGNLRAAGNADNVAGFRLEDFGLAAVRVDTLLNMVFVNLDDAAPPLAAAFPGLADDVRATVPDFDDLRLAVSDPLPGDYNWKFFPDMNECYHCPVLHTIMGESEGSYLDTSWESEEHELWMKHVIRGKAELDEDALPYDFGSRAIRDVNIWFMWPNLIFIAHQGAANFKVQATWPTGPESSAQVLDNFCLNVPPDEADMGHIRNYRDRIMAEDISAMANQQRAIKSRGYRQGRLMVDAERSWRSEHGTHSFQKLVWEALNGPLRERAGAATEGAALQDAATK